MIIYGKNKSDHDRNLIPFLESVRENGLTLNKEKLQFKKKSHSLGMNGPKKESV